MRSDVEDALTAMDKLTEASLLLRREWPRPPEFDQAVRLIQTCGDILGLYVERVEGK